MANDSHIRVEVEVEVDDQPIVGNCLRHPYDFCLSLRKFRHLVSHFRRFVSHLHPACPLGSNAWGSDASTLAPRHEIKRH